MDSAQGSAPVRARKLAITLDGSNAQTLVERMNIAGDPTASRSIGPGMLAVSGSAALPRQGSVAVITGVPTSGVSIAPGSADEAARAYCALDGAFVGVHWDAASETLTVVNDVLGMAPLYWQRSSHGLALFSETKAVTGEPDLAGWGAFLALGYCIGQRTLITGVERFPPATVLRFCPRDGRIELRRYWHWPESSRRASTDDLIDALSANVRQYAATCKRHTLFLSGGCDSRLILYLMKREGIDVQARIVAHADQFGNADGRYALAAARAAGIPYQICQPPADYYTGEDFLDYVTAIDAATTSLGLFISKVHGYVPDGGFWDGLMLGSLCSDFHISGGFPEFEAESIAGWEHENWRAARRLFGEETAGAMFTGFRKDLADIRAAYADNAAGVGRFAFEQRTRRRVAQNPLKAFANRGTPLVPGFHRDVFAAAATIPFDAKRGRGLKLDLLRRVHPRALHTPVLTGGRPLRRSRTDLPAFRLMLHARINDRIRRHPRISRSLHLRTADPPIPVPAFASRYAKTISDPWIDSTPLYTADPATWDGFVVWRLYFHWAAWRSIHTGESSARQPLRVDG